MLTMAAGRLRTNSSLKENECGALDSQHRSCFPRCSRPARTRTRPYPLPPQLQPPHPRRHPTTLARGTSPSSSSPARFRTRKRSMNPLRLAGAPDCRNAPRAELSRLRVPFQRRGRERRRDGRRGEACRCAVDTAGARPVASARRGPDGLAGTTLKRMGVSLRISLLAAAVASFAPGARAQDRLPLPASPAPVPFVPARVPGRVPSPASVMWVGAHPDDEVLLAPLLARRHGPRSPRFPDRNARRAGRAAPAFQTAASRTSRPSVAAKRPPRQSPSART